jgi:hypothetical protein
LAGIDHLMADIVPGADCDWFLLLLTLFDGRERWLRRHFHGRRQMVTRRVGKPQPVTPVAEL